MRRTTIRLAVVAAAAVTAVAGTAVASAAPTSTQISTKPAPDPGFSHFGATYYVYATSGSDGLLPIFSSASPTTTFARAGNAYTKAPSVLVNKKRVTLNNLWAPHVVSRYGTYFMFFTAAAGTASHCVYWASATTPTGTPRGKGKPRTFGAPHLIVCGATSPQYPKVEAIDPTVYANDKGTSFLIWKWGYNPDYPQGTYRIRAQALTFSHTGVSFAKGSSAFTLAQTPVNDGYTQTCEKSSFGSSDTVIEAPSVVAEGGKVWLFVARGDYRTNCYRTDALVNTSFKAGFHFSNRLMTTQSGYGYGPGGAEAIKVGSQYWIAYHVWTKSNPLGTNHPAGERVTRIARLTWSGGKPHVV